MTRCIAHAAAALSCAALLGISVAVSTNGRLTSALEFTQAYASSAYAASTTTADSIPPGYLQDTALSDGLTTYLKGNRLPLVRGQVFASSSGRKQVLLYGFVATETGKQNATIRARSYLGEPAVPVINRIAVRPELQSSSGPPVPPSIPPAMGSSDAYASGEVEDVRSYQRQGEEAQRQQQNLRSQQDIEAALLIARLLMGFL
jgi:hypothetical protein